MATFILNEKEIKLIKEVRDISRDLILKRATELDRIGDEKPDWIIPQYLAKKNLLAPTMPETYGGRGLSMMVTASIIEELAVACAGTAAIVVTNTYATTPILVAGNEKLKQDYLPALTSKEPRLACIAINEASSDFNMEAGKQEHKGDITRISTTADIDNNEVLINGSKDFVINGAVADFIVALVRSKDSKQKSTLQFYLIPSKTPGLIIGNTFPKIGMKSCHTVQVLFQDVKISPDHSIGSKGGGYLLLMQTFDRNLALVGAIAVGLAKGAYLQALQVAKKNKMLYENNSLYYYITLNLAEMSAKIDAARLAVFRAAYYIDNDENYSRVSIMAKLYATQVAQEVTSVAVDMVGKMGFFAPHPVEKYFRDAQMLTVMAGSDHLHRYVLASQL